MAGTASIYWISQTGGGGGSCPYDATFSTTTNWTESPAHTWIPTSGNNGEGFQGIISIAGDGYIYAEYDGTVNTYNTAIFLTGNGSPTSPYYANVEYGLYISDGSYSTAIDGVYTDLAVAAVSGDLFRVIRTGTTVKGQYYRSSSWTDLVTYPSGEFLQLYYGVSSADPGWAVKCVNPKYCN